MCIVISQFSELIRNYIFPFLFPKSLKIKWVVQEVSVISLVVYGLDSMSETLAMPLNAKVSGLDPEVVFFHRVWKVNQTTSDL